MIKYHHLMNEIDNNDVANKEELSGEEPSSLTESLELVRRLRLLSTTQNTEIHPFITQL